MSLPRCGLTAFLRIPVWDQHTFPPEPELADFELRCFMDNPDWLLSGSGVVIRVVLLTGIWSVPLRVDKLGEMD